MNWLYIFDLIGCAVFAISGALLAYDRRMDGIGVIVLAAVTAIGGGTLRDLLLDAKVFWLTDPNYLHVILFASLVSILWLNTNKRIPEKSLELADAFGLALFVIMGTQKALSFGVVASTAVVMGVMTGCFGGMLRDVLANRVPMILKKELYAMCALLGATVYTLLLEYSVFWASVTGFITVLVLRMGAIKWKWQIHVFTYEK